MEIRYQVQEVKAFGFYAKSLTFEPNRDERRAQITATETRIIREIILRTMRWVGHVASKVGEERCIQGLVRKSQGKKNYLKDLGIDGGIMLKWI